MNRFALARVLIASVAATLAVSEASSLPSKPIDEEEARLELSTLLQKDKRLKEAAAEYEALIKKFPERIDLRVEVANLYAAVGLPHEAWNAIASVAGDKLSDQGLRLRASLAAQLGRFSIAIDTLRRYLDRHPDDAEARLELADVLSWEKRYEESLAEFEKLVAANPDDIQLRRRYARVLGWAGRFGEAIKQWKISLAEDHPT